MKATADWDSEWVWVFCGVCGGGVNFFFFGWGRGGRGGECEVKGQLQQQKNVLVNESKVTLKIIILIKSERCEAIKLFQVKERGSDIHTHTHTHTHPANSIYAIYSMCVCGSGCGIYNMQLMGSVK